MTVTSGGIDEAGLGPLLGPYCYGSAVFSYPGELELTELLSPFFNDFPDLSIKDSKEIYKPKTGLGALESRIFPYLNLLKIQPETIKEYLSLLAVDSDLLDEMAQIPWYKTLGDFKLPFSASPSKIDNWSHQLKDYFDQNHIELKAIKINLATAGQFNKSISKGMNKALAGMEILSPLLKSVFDTPSDRITVDRLGGRKFYADLMINLFPKKPIQILQELKSVSRYKVQNSTIIFKEKADRDDPAVGLASLFAKYTREILMHCFNTYWQEKSPGIKPTAGYYTDGKRFIAELQKKEVSLGDEFNLIRLK